MVRHALTQDGAFRRALVRSCGGKVALCYLMLSSSLLGTGNLQGWATSGAAGDRSAPLGCFDGCVLRGSDVYPEQSRLYVLLVPCAVVAAAECWVFSLLTKREAKGPAKTVDSMPPWPHGVVVARGLSVFCAVLSCRATLSVSSACAFRVSRFAF